MYLANFGASKSLTKLTIYEIQTWMGDILLVNYCHKISRSSDADNTLRSTGFTTLLGENGSS
jgi:hypothetical protein